MCACGILYVLCLYNVLWVGVRLRCAYASLNATNAILPSQHTPKNEQRHQPPHAPPRLLGLPHQVVPHGRHRQVQGPFFVCCGMNRDTYSAYPVRQINIQTYNLATKRNRRTSNTSLRPRRGTACRRPPRRTTSRSSSASTYVRAMSVLRYVYVCNRLCHYRPHP